MTQSLLGRRSLFVDLWFFRCLFPDQVADAAVLVVFGEGQFHLVTRTVNDGGTDDGVTILLLLLLNCKGFHFLQDLLDSIPFLG